MRKGPAQADPDLLGPFYQLGDNGRDPSDDDDRSTLDQRVLLPEPLPIYKFILNFKKKIFRKRSEIYWQKTFKTASMPMMAVEVISNKKPWFRLDGTRAKRREKSRNLTGDAAISA